MFDLPLRAPASAPTSPRQSNGRVRVGIIECESSLVQVLGKRLEAMGWEHRVLPRVVVPEALVPMRLNVLVLDLEALGPGGWEYLERVSSRLPKLVVVLCTGPSSVAQRVRALRAGADACLIKPLHPEELIAVVESALRRHRRSELPQVEQPVTRGEIGIRPELHQAYVRDASLELTPREFEMLRLLSSADRVLRREEIYEQVWGYAMAHGDRSVDVFVRKLREKLRKASPSWSYIHTHFGVGYRFAAQREDGGEGAGGPEREDAAERAGSRERHDALEVTAAHR